MSSISSISIFVLLVCLFSVHAAATLEPQAFQDPYFNVTRSDFPKDFVFGASTASAQIEGSVKLEGKGPSVWDQFIREFPDRIVDRSNLDVAADSYERYKEDVQNVKDLGVDSYRFSIAWPRILPDGTLSGGINQKGIRHYNKLIDLLIKNGIKPFVTLMHFDSPEALQIKYGGFLNRTIVNDFKDYAEVCFKTFGDRVKNWITINEPYIMAKMGHALGIGPPGRCSNRQMCPHGDAATEPYIVAHNTILAHATAAKLYKEKYQAIQGGQIGISHVAQYIEPYSDSPLDKEAAKTAMDFDFGWFMDPMIRGDYPEIMRKLVKERLPVFSEEEKKLVQGSFDFIGINYYTARYARHIPGPNVAPPSYLVDSHVNVTVDRDGVPIGPCAGGSAFIYVYPEGLSKILKFMVETYSKDLAIYVTENGYTESSNVSMPVAETLKDQIRIEFVQEHLYQLHTAMKNGAKVKGYFYYSLVDSFEWGEGYTVRYGLYRVDFKELTRLPKESAKWYHQFLKGVPK